MMRVIRGYSWKTEVGYSENVQRILCRVSVYNSGRSIIDFVYHLNHYTISNECYMSVFGGGGWDFMSYDASLPSGVGFWVVSV